jgi:lipopolysaccharide export system permease protein
MKVLSRYLLREFFKLFALCEGIFVFLYLVIDFMEKVNNAIESKASKGSMLLHFLYETPFIVSNMIPPATLIAVVMLFSNMKKRNEITALKANGLNLFSLSRILLGASLLTGALVFVLSETVVPYTTSKSNRIWNIEVEKQDPTLFYGKDQIWYKGTNSIYWIRHYDSKKKLMEGLSFFFFDKDFRLVKRIDGRTGRWENGFWRIGNGIIQTLGEGGDYGLKRFRTLDLRLPEGPETFMAGTRKPEEMNYWQLKRYAERVKDEGYDNSIYLVDMNVKVAFPLISVVLVLIGIPISLRLSRGGMPLAVCCGIAVCFLYLVVMGFSRSLGLSGTLPPLLAAWLANIVFLLIGTYLMIGLEK